MAFQCPHFPLLETLALPLPILVNYARLTHQDHPSHLAYRADLERYARTGSMQPEGAPPAPAPVVTVVVLPRATGDESETSPRADGETVSPVPTPSAPSRTHSYQERVELVYECDYRGEQLQGTDGGCSCIHTWHCGRAAGMFVSNPREVAFAECIECVSRPNPD